MKTQFSIDLRVARKCSGLTQADCAHLLKAKQSRISALESGQVPPTLRELCALSLVFNRRFECLIEDEIKAVSRQLRTQLNTLPKAQRSYVVAFNRGRTLTKLRCRLEAKRHTYDSAL